MILGDIKRYAACKGYPRWLLIFTFHQGYRFMVLYRLCNRFSKINPIGFLARIWYKKIQVKYGFQIPFTTRIGKGLFLPHYGNIVINPKVLIGENCNVAQGVTLGQINVGDKAGCPAIGNRVWIGANAVVVGNIKIGDDVLIAPLSYVNFDVPSGSVVLGNPGKIVGDKGSSGYVNYLV